MDSLAVADTFSQMILSGSMWRTAFKRGRNRSTSKSSESTKEPSWIRSLVRRPELDGSGKILQCYIVRSIRRFLSPMYVREDLQWTN